MPSCLLHNTHGLTMSCMGIHRPWESYMVMECYYRPWIEYTVRRRQPWQFYNRPWTTHTVVLRRTLTLIIALGQYTSSDYIGCEMLSSPLERIHYLKMSGVTCYGRPWTSHTIRGCWAWHARMSLEQHTWLDDIRRGMPLSPLENIHGGTRLRAIL